MRASHMISQEPKKHEDDYPSYTHRVRKPVTPGTTTALEIPIWPLGMVFGAGEGIAIIIAGHDCRLPELDGLEPTSPLDMNVGKHVVYTGGDQASFLMLPFLEG